MLVIVIPIWRIFFLVSLLPPVLHIGPMKCFFKKQLTGLEMLLLKCMKKAREGGIMDINICNNCYICTLHLIQVSKDTNSSC